jgi:hypothetical protein
MWVELIPSLVHFGVLTSYLHKSQIYVCEIDENEED